MIRAVLLLISLSAAAPTAHRSRGYAGSTPVGLDGNVALATVDCERINADARRSRVRVPLSADCVIDLPSPNGHVILLAQPERDETISLVSEGEVIVAKLVQPTTLLWNPNSSGFLLNDSGGSGQVSRLRYFYKAAAGWIESRKLATAASMLYRRRFDCRGGRNSYTNVSGWSWQRPDLLRVIVQEGVHSQGCLQPHADRNVLFEVAGDPVTGRIASAHEIATLP